MVGSRDLIYGYTQGKFCRQICSSMLPLTSLNIQFLNQAAGAQLAS